MMLRMMISVSVELAYADGIAGYWYLPVHRYYIQTEILHFTIILHVSEPCSFRYESTIVLGVLTLYCILHMVHKARSVLMLAATVDVAETKV
jgi:hypothetical protein